MKKKKLKQTNARANLVQIESNQIHLFINQPAQVTKKQYKTIREYTGFKNRLRVTSKI